MTRMCMLSGFCVGCQQEQQQTVRESAGCGIQINTGEGHHNISQWEQSEDGQWISLTSFDLTHPCCSETVDLHLEMWSPLTFTERPTETICHSGYALSSHTSWLCSLFCNLLARLHLAIMHIPHCSRALHRLLHYYNTSTLFLWSVWINCGHYSYVAEMHLFSSFHPQWNPMLSNSSTLHTKEIR